MSSQKLDQHLVQTTRLSQQQLYFVRLLEMNAPELDDAVANELESNLALEANDVTPAPDTLTPSRVSNPFIYNRSAYSDDGPVFTPSDDTENLYDILLGQLNEKDLEPKVLEAARFIVGSLDSNGYLNRSVRDLTDDMVFSADIDVSIDDVQKALDVVRSLDPPGIGAYSLRDCLRLQLDALSPSPSRDVALQIINECYDAFIMKHTHRIKSLLHLDDKIIAQALSLIKNLNPKPGASIGNDPSTLANVIIPDFIVNNYDGELTITLNNRIPELRIEESFEQAKRRLDLAGESKNKSDSKYILNSYDNARDFIRILNQRQETMMKVMSAIVKIQKEYFLTEDVYTLKPMMIKNVADITGLDISVISRATSNKYVSLPWGTFPLRFFFSASKGEEKEGSEVATNRIIEAQIAALVEKEDKCHPLSDQHIMERLAEKGFDISRRTVAKYRQELDIPVARLRKQM
ncbi:MAG: RNA polymerase factor sigma-54 [Muribaculaceae bacterium]|nr:RNA polymerase factor sigma-54 [Muribaculaceae bacterium]